MRILVCTYSFWPSVGGQEIVAERIARRFHARGHEACVLTYELSEGAGDFPFPVHRRPSRKQTFELIRWSDVVISKQMSLVLCWPLAILKRTHFVLYATWLHPKEKLAVRLLRKRILGRAVNIANSVALGRSLAHYDAVVYPGYDAATFQNRVPWTERERDFIFVGRIARGKGLDLLIEALARLPGRSLTIVGNGPEQEENQALSEWLGVADRVQFVGAQPHTKINSLLNQHKVCVVPSRAPEPYGTVATEAVAAGCEVVVSNDGGLPEAAGPTSWLFSSGDAAHLAVQMNRAITLAARLQIEEHLVSDHLVSKSFETNFASLVNIVESNGSPEDA